MRPLAPWLQPNKGNEMAYSHTMFSGSEREVTSMTQRDKQSLAPDRRENDGGAPSLISGAIRVPPDRPNGQDRFVADLLEETARVLKDLNAAGGHDEAHSDGQRQAMIDLMSRRLVNRTTYKHGLVIYEITDAGRDYVRGLPS
jgi:hypothetical protein